MWLRAQRKAEALIEGRRDEETRLVDALETNLTLLGATGVEDKLSPGVPEALWQLRGAGMTLWVLTGDKRVRCVPSRTQCVL